MSPPAAMMSWSLCFRDMADDGQIDAHEITAQYAHYGNDYLLLRLSSALPPICIRTTSGTPTLFWNLRTYLNSHSSFWTSYLRASPTTPPPPQTSCSKDMDLGHLLVVGNPQVVYPPSFLLLVSTPLAPPVVYLRYLPTPTLPLVTLFLIVLSFDISYNTNIPDYDFRALDSSGCLPL
ncbi:uncharacterized protein EI90DRAFT_3133228 [Cantharellus anzutake]|uniref:uncharacterized protein n=1 Tax=Cantharellus anzutake TaxID=1750568 RepID=UPI0019067729|nr:uncharacterized protein EI90DRAFT_3133228 [Cantharellus anzutake]KAF8318343.1 hypothetical protein EI90DRAFT_3133228 [Cantharellus anzutake]